MTTEINEEIVYDFNKKDKTIEGEGNNINIFGYDFVKNNIDICKMIIDNKEYKLAEQFDIQNNNNNNILKIKLKRVEKITNFRGMFMNCSSLQSITLPNSVEEIGVGAFLDCSSLQTITIPNSVTALKDEAFKGCTSLEYVILPNSLQRVGINVFKHCPSLKEIIIPKSLDPSIYEGKISKAKIKVI